MKTSEERELYALKLKEIQEKLNNYKECRNEIIWVMELYGIERTISDFELHARKNNFGYEEMTLQQCLDSLNFEPCFELKGLQLRNLLTAIEAIKMIHNEY